MRETSFNLYRYYSHCHTLFVVNRVSNPFIIYRR